MLLLLNLLFTGCCLKFSLFLIYSDVKMCLRIYSFWFILAWDLRASWICPLVSFISLKNSQQLSLYKRCYVKDNWSLLYAKYPGLFSVQFSSVTQLCPTFCNPVNHSTPSPTDPCHPCPSPTPRVYPNSCPLSRWCHLTISSSVVPFSSCLQSFPTSGSFQISQLFSSGGQNIGVSASTSVLPMNTQDWFPLGWTDWISLQSKGLSRVFSNTTVQKHQFLVLSFLYSPTLTSIHDHRKNHSLD